MNILYVEDDPRDADMTRRELRQTAPHFQLDVVSTQREALARLEGERAYDLVLADMRLPDGDGRAVLAHIRDRGLPLAVVIITGFGDEESVVAVLKAGADDYVIKSADYLTRLPRLLEDAVQRYRAGAARRARPLRVLYAEHSASDIDLTRRHFVRYAPHLHLEVVNTAPEVLQRLSARDPASEHDVLLLDYRLPGMNALELLKELIQARGLSIPIVFVTGQGDQEIALQVLKLGAVDYVPKHANYLFQLPGVLENAFHRAQLARKQAALRASEERFSKAFHSSPVATSISTLPDGRLLDVNESFLRLLGYRRDEVVGRTALELGLWADPAARAEIGQRLLDQGAVQRAESNFRTNAGEIREALASAQLIDLGGVSCVLTTLEDVTERNQRERELEAIATVSAVLRTAPTRAEMLPIILDQTLDLLRAEGAALVTDDPANAHLLVELGRGQWIKMTGARLASGEGVSGRVIETGQPYVSADLLADPRLARPELHGDLPAAACIPLVARDQIIGALWVGRASPFTPGEVRVLTAIADIAANALHRVTLHEQTEQHLRRLQALHTIDRAISSSLDLRVTLNILLDQVVALLRVHAALVLLFKPPLQTLEYAMGRGFRGHSVTRLRLKLGEGQAGRAALERRLVGLPDLAEAESSFPYPELLAGEDFRAFYAVPLIAKGQVVGVLEIFHRSPLPADPEWLNFLEMLAGQTAIAIENAQLFDGLQRSNADLAVAYDATIEGWSRALDLRDKETEGHTQRVAEMTLKLARGMGLSGAELVHVRRGALLHDIGKMGVPDGILLKPGPLTDEEWVVMRKHPEYAYEMLYPIVYLRPALDIPYAHHEKWDGTGYPRGLKGEAIPLAARLFAVVDVWDALRSDRPYRAAWPEEKVREHIRSLSGTHFDPQVVEVFLRELRED